MLCKDVCIIKYLFFFQAEDGIRDLTVTGVQTCALPICDPKVSESVKDLFTQLPLLEVADGFWQRAGLLRDRKSTRLNSSHSQISYAVFCLKKKKTISCTYTDN